MWIIFFNHVPTFWLVGDSVYRVGCKDAHILIENDRSISRTHLSIEVGSIPWGEEGTGNSLDPRELLCSPASITLIDSSTYGTVVVPCGTTRVEEEGAQDAGIPGLCRTVMPPQNEKEVISDVVRVKGAKRDRAAVEEEVLSTGERHTLTKGTPFHVPLQKAVWSQFTAVMGNHGAAVRLAWLPLTAVVEGVAVELAVKLEHALAACGVQLLSLTTTASQGAHPLYPVADYLITGTIEASAAVVAMLCKSSPIVTPQYFIAVKDRASPLDPLPPPEAYQPPPCEFWKTLLGDRASELLRPHPDRCQLLRGVVFVVVQPALYQEVTQYIPCAQGRVVLEECLKETTDRRSALSTFFQRHRQHVLLYNTTEVFPSQECLSILTEQTDLCCVEYAILIESIAHVRPLGPFTYPRDQPDWERLLAREAGRTSDSRPLYPSSAVPEDRSQGGATAPPDGWVYKAPHTSHASKQYCTVLDQPQTPPLYPCFIPSSKNATSSNGKPFKKQKLCDDHAGPCVELDRTVVEQQQNPLTSRGARVFSEDMLASHTTMIGEGFNPFDISMLNATHKRKGTVPAAKKSNPTNKRSTKTPAAPVQEVTVDVEAPTGNGNNIQQNNNNNKKAKPNNNNATYNIFDIDGIF